MKVSIVSELKKLTVELKKLTVELKKLTVELKKLTVELKKLTVELKKLRPYIILEDESYLHFQYMSSLNSSFTNTC